MGTNRLKIMRFFFILLLSICATNTTQAQFSLNNASFEGEAQDATIPVGWIGCEPNTTPDILPGYWGVYTEASEGETYAGIITRMDGTFESIAQRTKKPLKKGICYGFAMDLAYSKTYSGYNGKIKLKIWGGATKCDKTQLLYESGVIENTNWLNHNIQFTPKSKLKYLIFEASFDGAKPKFYNGNLLMDNISPIKGCNRA